jgi:hypothetical protein
MKRLVVVLVSTLAVASFADPPAALQALLGDEQLALADKRAALREYVASLPANLSWVEGEAASELVATARPFEHQYELCLDLFGLLPADAVATKEVRVEAYDNWGAPTSAVVEERGRIVTTGHVRRREVPSCLPGLFVRFVPNGPTVATPFVEGVAIARMPGHAPLTTFGGFFEDAIVPRGWGEEERAYVSGGIRAQTWRRYVHVDASMKFSTFSVPWLLELPGGLAVDLFVGFPFELPSENADVRLSLDLGMWATFCPSFRVSSLARVGHFFAGLDLGLHLYPMALTPAPDRPTNQRRLTLGNYLFLSAGLTAGYSL